MSLVDVNTCAFFLKSDDFNNLLGDFPEFDQFIRTRAIRRRAYFRYLESEMVSEILKKTLDSSMESSSDFDNFTKEEND
jgi:hypothetical protein